MYTSNKRELFTAIHYLMIGIIAEGSVLRWFKERPPAQQMLAWFVIALVLSIIRFLVLSLSEWTRKDDWQSVSRRNW